MRRNSLRIRCNLGGALRETSEIHVGTAVEERPWLNSIDIGSTEPNGNAGETSRGPNRFPVNLRRRHGAERSARADRRAHPSEPEPGIRPPGTGHGSAPAAQENVHTQLPESDRPLLKIPSNSILIINRADRSL